MRALWKLIVSLFMAVFQLFSPSGPAPEEPAPEPAAPAVQNTAEWVTLGDVLSLESSNHEATWNSEKYQYLFEYEGTVYLVTAAFSQEQLDALNSVDFFADDREEQKRAILAPSVILSVENLSLQMPAQAELDQWIGRSAQEMVDAGWECDGIWQMGDETDLIMISGKFSYRAAVEGEVEVDTSGFFDVPKDISGATVISIEYQGTSYHVFD